MSAPKTIPMRYIKPAPTGVACTLKGRFLEDKRRIVMAESELLDAAGEPRRY